MTVLPSDDEQFLPASHEDVMAYRDALWFTMNRILSENAHAIIMGQGVDDHKGIFGSTLGLVKAHGKDRVFDTPLAEEGMTGIAVGAALNGLYPIQTHIRLDFAMLAMNQIINLVSKYKYMFGGRFEIPMLIRLVIGRSWGQGAQHSQSLQSLFGHIPGLTIIMPSDSQSVLDAYPYAALEYRGPVLSLEHRLLYDLKFRIHGSRKSENMPPWRTRVVRKGKDVTVVATSIMVLEALRAAQHLDDVSGIDCEVVDYSCVSNPDEELIYSSVEKTGRLLVADTSWAAYGVCAEVTRLVCARNPKVLKSPVRFAGMQPSPCPTAKTLEDIFYPNLCSLTDDIACLVTGKSDHGIPVPDERSFADIYKRFKGPF